MEQATKHTRRWSEESSSHLDDTRHRPIMGFGASSSFGAWVLAFGVLASWAVRANALDSPPSAPSASTSEPQLFRGWVTNGPAVFAGFRFPAPQPFATNADGLRIRRPVSKLLENMTNLVFDHFLPGSLNYLVWTNFMAHTNGRTTRIWSVRTRPLDWPTNPPTVKWDTQSLLWGFKGLTALSPAWENGMGQVPITALTRRHGYTRGHGTGADGFRTNYAGKKVWFLAADNTLIQTTVARGVVRTTRSPREDYTILLFSKDLPPSIQPIRVVGWTNFISKYPAVLRAPWLILETEQGGNVSAGLPGFSVDTWKGGDSGSPNLLPLPGELVFVSGRSTSGPTPAMQADMDELCRQEGLDPKRYQMQWVDLSRYPSY